MRTQTKFNPLLALSFGLIALNLGRRFAGRDYLKEKVALVTGGSKGLGFVLARRLGDQGCKVVICARDPDELEHAADKLRARGIQVLPIVCDVSEPQQVEDMVLETVDTFGHLDILVNNAGILQVGPMESFARGDYEKAMDVMYWGIANTTFSAMKHMRDRRRGHIVNITSVGAKISLPHLLPYNASKSAALGFSEGLATELAKDGICVTTIVPGLMRTGSFVNAQFGRGAQREFNLFSGLSGIPFLSLSPERAAKLIVNAIKDRKRYKVLGFQARALIQLHHFFPNTTIKVLELVNRVLPKAPDAFHESGGRLMRENALPRIRRAVRRFQNLES